MYIRYNVCNVNNKQILHGIKLTNDTYNTYKGINDFINKTNILYTKEMITLKLHDRVDASSDTHCC